VSIDNLGDALSEYNESGEVLPSYIVITNSETGDVTRILEDDHV